MKLNHSFFFFALSLAATSMVYAEERPEPRNNLPEERIQVAKPQLAQPQPVQTESSDNKHTLSITKEELAKHPDLIIRGLIPAVLQNNTEAVELLLPLYQNLPQQDPFLLAWAEAIIATKQGNYSRAVQEYRTLFAQRPDILQLRYQLAHALFLNNDNEAAKDQFQKLRAEVNDEQSQHVIDQYLTAINQRDQWRISGGISFLNESNVSNAPKAGTRIGGWQAWQRESAHGLSYYLSSEKKWSLPKNVFAKFIWDGQGKYYWDNKKYNEFNARIGAGLGYQTANTEVVLLPFAERRWYSGGSSGSDAMKQFSKNSGVRFELSHWFHKMWQISTALEYGEQRYVKRKHLSGNNYLWSNTLLFLPYSGQYWFAGVDYNRENTRDSDNAYQRKNLRLGWVQEWPLGISTRISLAYARRTYNNIDFFSIRQKNNEYQAALTVWHRNLYFLGITPKLTWSYQKNDSNHPFYRYDKSRIYLEMSKTF
ncbi:surface lipoprotein assembly modifier [Aggregatibacter actinomycetemcomitans]